MQIRVLTTGGTIDKIYYDRKDAFTVGEPQIGDLLREANVALDWVIEPLLRKDSLDLCEEDRLRIRRAAEQAPEEKVLITHGTDTMVQTALTLQNIPGKTIILVGSMQPALFRQSDAEFNIGAAVMALQLLPCGVYIAMHGRIFDPAHTRKNVDLHRFEEIPPPEAS